MDSIKAHMDVGTAAPGIQINMKLINSIEHISGTISCSVHTTSDGIYNR